MDQKTILIHQFAAILAEARKRHSKEELWRIEGALAVAAGAAAPAQGHALQNDTFVFEGIPSKAWHDPKDFPQVDTLLSSLEVIRAEFLANRERDIGFRAHAQGSAPHTGGWDVSRIKGRARVLDEDRAIWPKTARIVEELPGIAQLAMISALRPGCHIKPHCGPWNVNLTIHMPLVVPPGDCAIRVGDEARPWKEGECLVFDDSFEHEAWNRTAATRFVLLIDIWHPSLSAIETELLQAASDVLVANTPQRKPAERTPATVGPNG